MSRNRIQFLYDFAALLGSRGAGEVLAALVGLLLIRYLGAEEYARYVLAMTALGLAGVVVRSGMNTILTREVSQRSERAPTLLTHAILFRLASAAVVYALGYNVIRLWPAAGDPRLFLIAGLAFFPGAFEETVVAVLRGLDRIPLSAGVKFIVKLLEAGLVIAVLLTFRQTGPVLAAGVGARLAGAVLSMVVIRRVSRPSTNLLPDVWGRLASMGLPLMLMGLASSAFQSLDIYVVSHFLGQTAVGQYGAALRVFGLLLTVPTIWSAVALPRFSRAAGAPGATFRLLAGSWLTLGLGSIALAAIFAVLARPLTAWVLGARYALAAGVLRVLTASFALAGLTAPLTTLLTAHNRQGAVTVVVGLAGLLGLAANLLIGGRLGLTGVALVRAVSMLFVLVACSWLSAGLIETAASSETELSAKPRSPSPLDRDLIPGSGDSR